MNILLINIDSTIPNLALKKIEFYHKQKGDNVIWDFPLMLDQCEKVYVSCVFPENRQKCLTYEGIAEIGGSGYDIYKKLPEEIEAVKPRINLGYTTRGCIRNCYFCFVPKMEGKIRAVGDIYDLWDGQSKTIKILDNNIMALPDHFKMTCKQIKAEGLRVDFNQGLDARLLTDDLCKAMFSIKHFQNIRFAFDDIRIKPQVEKAFEVLKRNGLKKWGTRWYIYIGEKDTVQSVYDRIVFIKSHDQLCYVMRDKKIYNNPQFIALSRWANSVGSYKQDFYELLDKAKWMKMYKKFF